MCDDGTFGAKENNTSVHVFRRLLDSFSYVIKFMDVVRVFCSIEPTQRRPCARDRTTQRNPLICSHSWFVYNPFKLQDKRLKLSLNGNRKIVGTLRGYDAFLNVVIEDAEGDGGTYLGQLVIRGNSIVQFEALERVN